MYKPIKLTASPYLNSLQISIHYKSLLHPTSLDHWMSDALFYLHTKAKIKFPKPSPLSSSLVKWAANLHLNCWDFIYVCEYTYNHYYFTMKFVFLPFDKWVADRYIRKYIASPV